MSALPSNTLGTLKIDDYPRPKVRFLPPENSGITIMGVMIPVSSDYLLGIGPDYTLFQIIRNHHEVNILGPPLASGVTAEEGCSIQLELIETLLDTVPFDKINQATLYITGDGRARLIPQICTIIPKILFISGVRCIEDSELKVTSWLYVGWKLALLDGIPVEVIYAFDDETAYVVRNRVEAMRQLLPLDLTTPLKAFLVSDGAIYGVVTQIEDAQPMSYADRTLVHAAFAKLQERHIYLTEADYDPQDIVIVGDKVRFILEITGNWTRHAFEFDPKIHDQKTLLDARKTHWQVAEQLFEKLAPGTEIRELWAPSDFTTLPDEAYNILNLVFSPEKPLSILAFMMSITSLSDNTTFLSKKKRLEGSSQVTGTNRSVAESSSSLNETCHLSPSDESIDSSIVRDRPLNLSKRSSATRPSAFLHNYLGIPTPLFFLILLDSVEGLTPNHLLQFAPLYHSRLMVLTLLGFNLAMVGWKKSYDRFSAYSTSVSSLQCVLVSLIFLIELIFFPMTFTMYKAREGAGDAGSRLV